MNTQTCYKLVTKHIISGIQAKNTRNLNGFIKSVKRHMLHSLINQVMEVYGDADVQMRLEWRDVIEPISSQNDRVIVLAIYVEPEQR